MRQPNSYPLTCSLQAPINARANINCEFHVVTCAPKSRVPVAIRSRRNSLRTSQLARGESKPIFLSRASTGLANFTVPFAEALFPNQPALFPLRRDLPRGLHIPTRQKRYGTAASLHRKDRSSRDACALTLFPDRDELPLHGVPTVGDLTRCMPQCASRPLPRSAAGSTALLCRTCQ